MISPVFALSDEVVLSLIGAVVTLGTMVATNIFALMKASKSTDTLKHQLNGNLEKEKQQWRDAFDRYLEQAIATARSEGEKTGVLREQGRAAEETRLTRASADARPFEVSVVEMKSHKDSQP